MHVMNQVFPEISNIYETRHTVEIPSEVDERICDWARSSALSSTERLRRLVIAGLAQPDSALASLPLPTAGSASIHRALTLPRDIARQVAALARRLDVAPEQLMASLIQSRLDERLAA